MDIDVRAAGRESLATSISPSPTARFTSACRRSKAAAAARAKRSSRRGKKGGPFKRPVRLLRAGRCRRREQGDDRNAHQGRRVRFASARKRSQLVGRDRAGHAIRRSRSPPIARAARRSSSAAATTSQPPKPPSSLPDMPEWPDRETAQKEKEVLGFYLTSHPLAEHKRTLATYCSHTTADIAAARRPRRSDPRRHDLVAQILDTRKNPQARQAVASTSMFDLEDIDGTIRCILWPDGFAEMGHLVRPTAILIVRGVIDRRGGDEANLIVNELIPLDQLDSRYTTGIVVRIDETRARRRTRSTRSARSSAPIPATANCNSLLVPRRRQPRLSCKLAQSPARSHPRAARPARRPARPRQPATPHHAAQTRPPIATATAAAGRRFNATAGVKTAKRAAARLPPPPPSATRPPSENSCAG